MNEITIDLQKAQRVANSTGIENAIYSQIPICPGIYLYSLAEQIVRKNNRFNLPLNIRASFLDYVVDKEILKISSDFLTFKDYKPKTKITFSKDHSTIAKFEFREISERENKKIELLNPHELIYEIKKENIERFMKELDYQLKDDSNSVYSSFGLGIMINNFLKGREGSLLNGLDFDVYYELLPGNLKLFYEVNENITKENDKIKWVKYSINGKFYQYSNLIGTGNGFAQNKVMK